MYKLLIADDEAFERKILHFILKKNFSNIEIVAEAANGDEAILLAQKYKPDIIIMDIKMPGKNGLESQQSIIQFNPNVKTIILTASEDFSFIQKDVKLGVVDYLLKPIRPNDLSNSIAKAIYLLQNEKTFFKCLEDLWCNRDSVYESTIL